jgi:hypothetical protein
MTQEGGHFMRKREPAQAIKLGVKVRGRSHLGSALHGAYQDALSVEKVTL